MFLHKLQAFSVPPEGGNLNILLQIGDFRAPGEAERKKYAPILKRYKEARFLIGHTVVQRTSYGITDKAHHGRISPVFDGRVLNLDCGCGSGMSLGCLCLDTMEEFYIDAEDVS